MSNERHILNKVDNIILDKLKESITEGIDLLLERNVRRTNIEIELMKHIKESLKHE